MSIDQIQDKVSAIKVLVIGDLMIDHYMWGTCERVSPEAPVLIVDVKKEEITLGGAGNVIKNLDAFGVYSDILSVIGTDIAGDEVIELLKNKNTGIDYMFRDPGRLTSKKSRVLASGHQMIRIDKETKASISTDAENHIIDFVKKNVLIYNIVLISDYLKGVLTDSLLSRIITCCRENNVPVIVDPKGNNYLKYKGATIIKPNKKEASIASAINILDKQDIENAALYLKKQLDTEAVVITLSEEGIAIYDDHFEIIPTKASEVFDVTGAGDTVLAGLGLCIAVGLSIQAACMFANHAAAIVVSKVGSATATLSEVLEHIKLN